MEEFKRVVVSKVENEIKVLINSLFDKYGYEINAATKEQMYEFEIRAIENGVSSKAISELSKLYSITNGIDPSLDSLWICKAEDSMKYEFWYDQKKLWIGQRDMDLLSWKDDRFHIGDAGELNYGEDYVFDNIYDFIIKIFNEMNPQAQI